MFQKPYCTILPTLSMKMQCFFPQNMVQQIRTPLFILNAAYDSWQVWITLAPSVFCCAIGFVSQFTKPGKDFLEQITICQCQTEYSLCKYSLNHILNSFSCTQIVYDSYKVCIDSFPDDILTWNDNKKILWSLSPLFIFPSG